MSSRGQCNHLPAPQAVDGEQQQDGSIANVRGSVSVGAGDQSANVLPSWTHRQRFVLEQARPLDPGGDAVAALTCCGHVGKERSQRTGSRRDRYPAPPLSAPHRQKGVHLLQVGRAGGAMLLVEPRQERLDMPAAVVDGVRRQAAFHAHVRGELVNQVSAGARRYGRGLESPHEAQPIGRDLHEPLAAETCSPDTTVSSLMPDPTVGGRPDLLERVIALVPSMSKRSRDDP